MKSTADTNSSTITYKQIAAAYEETCSSLLSPGQIAKTLLQEKKRFENASALQISPLRFIGNNTNRHCKDMLRKNQPFFPLYLLISFFTEYFAVLLIASILIGGFQHFFIQGASFNQPFNHLGDSILIMWLLIYQYGKKAVYMKYLASSDSPDVIRRKLRTGTILSAIIPGILCILALILFLILFPGHPLLLTPLSCLLLYVACTLAAGIHNVLFDSHVVSFLTIGISLFSRESSGKTKEAVKHYQQLVFQRMQGKPIPLGTCSTDVEQNHSTSVEKNTTMNTALRSRMVTFRIYSVLALFILIILDGLCVTQLVSQFSFTFLLFFLVSALGSFTALVVFFSAHTVIHSLPVKR